MDFGRARLLRPAGNGLGGQQGLRRRFRRPLAGLAWLVLNLGLLLVTLFAYFVLLPGALGVLGVPPGTSGDGGGPADTVEALNGGLFFMLTVLPAYSFVALVVLLVLAVVGRGKSRRRQRVFALALSAAIGLLYLIVSLVAGWSTEGGGWSTVGDALLGAAVLDVPLLVFALVVKLPVPTGSVSK